MCGVVGVIGREAEELARKATERMAHRGIRSSVIDEIGASIGHVRLPIVGVGEENDQPVRRGPWTVGFVGEILDFKKYRPRADCDLGLVADTWVNNGPEGFRFFDGFWSVVAMDWRDGSLHALVDYLAQKPLYVRRSPGFSAVASEPDAVACLAPVALDGVYLSSVAKWGYCPETWRTPYAGVTKILPGEHLHIGCNGQIVSSRVDTLTPGSVDRAGLVALVEEAVKLRVQSSDVPVACLVSGGLDSSIVYTLAQRYGDVRAYHVENGELPDCMRVAPEAEILNCEGVGLEKALEYMQEPLDLGSLLPQVALSDAIAGSGGERVCLTGDGADELFGGYGRAIRYDSQASDVWHELVAWHLPRLDRVMMRNKIEVRSPFLSRRVVEAALGTSREDRMGKFVLRKAFEGILPAGVAWLQKRALRTEEVSDDREGRSIDLINLFRRRELCRAR